MLSKQVARVLRNCYLIKVFILVDVSSLHIISSGAKSLNNLSHCVKIYL